VIDDAPSLARHADERDIWLNLRDRFPHPYTQADAEWWINHTTAKPVVTDFGIIVDGQAAGGISLMPCGDVERVSAEIGYWLGKTFWGRGIATEALIALTQYAFDHLNLTRVFAIPYAHNAASVRVLEKAGYQFEGRMRRSAIKDGVVTDQLLYASIRAGE
jgi:RimJ/RimL family protein N-acetyltransferase